ncbi:DNA-binding protein [Achromobacter deleyi]|uniref:DNA-binding protein n=1 Tax=Achromobacter deleyi TaxID=1353891 RepID=UPI0014658F66|nr:DNA-binding protein [Achromobacter deleyi]CAB3836132.1 hypothetical protein LMG3412_01001 [Achromobacter deleyi]
MATGIQEADVWAAADALLQAGEQPTIERIRLHLGRGSPNTVGPHLKAWFRGLGSRLDTPGQGSGLPEPLARMAGQLWESAMDAARGQWAAGVAQEREALTQAQAALQAEREAFAHEKARIDMREADLEDGIRAARAQAAGAEDRARALDAQLRESLRIIDALRGKLEQSQTNERDVQQALRQALADHQAALTATQERHAAHERRWLGDLDAQRQLLKKAQESLDQQRKAAVQEAASQAERIGALQSEQEQRAREAAEARAGAAQLAAELQAARDTHATAQAGLQQRSDDLAARIQEQQAQLQTKDRQIDLLMQAVGRYQQEDEDRATQRRKRQPKR